MTLPLLLLLFYSCFAARWLSGRATLALLRSNIRIARL